MKRLDPNMTTFLLDHPAARSIVWRMMRTAATTRDDSKMISWYAPVEACGSDREARDRAFEKLTNGV